MKWSRNQIISLYEAEDNCVIKVFMTQLSFATHSLPSMTPHWLCKFTSHFLSDAFKCPMLAAGESQQVYASRCISFWLFRSLRLLDQRLWWMSSHPALRDQASQIAISTQISSGQAPVLHSEPHLVCKCKGNTKQTFQSTAICELLPLKSRSFTQDLQKKTWQVRVLCSNTDFLSQRAGLSLVGWESKRWLLQLINRKV